ncbi:hypothetical protein ANCDUO_02253 [Ancylostoma duodenale]|uniref:Uncharacterized protein n=1 Tax=Ancylostoma duodenale TaxID=51022 RepID=A0A0C2H0Z8_9BILA|nr:hypothetical protein ANCDUO_02253 [Ancylostoma duodenale]
MVCLSGAPLHEHGNHLAVFQRVFPLRQGGFVFLVLLMINVLLSLMNEGGLSSIASKSAYKTPSALFDIG